MVKILVNLAYAPRSVTREFVFGPGIATTFKAALDKEKRANQPF
jgi:hypothetical protein